MKPALIIITTCAVLLLGTGSSRATNVNLFGDGNKGGNYSGGYQSDYSNNDGGNNRGGNGNDNNYGGNDNGNNNDGHNNSYSGDGNNDGNGDNGKNNKGNYKNGGYSLPSWSSYDGDKGKDGKGNVPPPDCAPADPGHGKYGDWNGGKNGAGDNGKFGRHYINYYKDLCDRNKHKHDGGYPRDCDPGSATPLPGSFWMFAAGLAILGLRKKLFMRAAK